MTDSLYNWLNILLTHNLNDSLFNWLSILKAHYLTDSLANWLTSCLTHYLTDSLYNWHTGVDLGFLWGGGLLKKLEKSWKIGKKWAKSWTKWKKSLKNWSKFCSVGVGGPPAPLLNPPLLTQYLTDLLTDWLPFVFYQKNFCYVKFFSGAPKALNTINSSLRSKISLISIFSAWGIYID